MRLIMFGFLTLIFIGCKKESVNINGVTTSIPKLHEFALKGDLNAYSDLSLAYLDSPNDVNFCQTSKNVAEKYNFPEAYLNLYYCQIDYYHRPDRMNLEDLNDNEIKNAMNYLVKGSNLKNRECSKLLGEYYIQGKYLKKNTQLGNSLIQDNK
ncbi:hypothetical protein [Flavobacterium sp.]|uniref:hypothetical protein n=1 Tax=Flavobacterium sp. TaxID=239 RepID=UPI0039E40BA3